MKNFSITKNGKPLDKSLYTWDEKTRTLATEENQLVLDFISYDSCTFDTGSSCTFKTGSSCTFDTGSNCIFKTGFGCTFDTGYNCTFKTSDNCTFDTGSNCIFKTGFGCTFKTSDNCTFDTGFGCTFKTSDNCTFDTGSNCAFYTGSNCTFNTNFDCTFKTSFNCVLIRRDVFEFYDVSNVENLKTAPYKIAGYVKDGYYYKDGKKQYRAINADGILSEIILQRKNVYKVKNYGKDEITYLVQDGDVYSHGKTLKEAKESLIYKLSNRDTSQYKDYTLDTKVTKKEAIQMYRAITGACEQGTKMFVESLDKAPKSLTIKRIIGLTKGQYGNDTFRRFFGEVKE